jgi:hypothetical protein
VRLSFQRWSYRYSRFNREDRASSDDPSSEYYATICSSRDYDSNGRLGGEIGGVDGDATPDLAESIGKFWFISQRGAALIGREC